ncbi:MAG: hypothetical protein BA862_04440 [Desulfobulbaceae bacterium S3730MH12]|nr:MAG: hypothetical protein BA862_04440 [Desulfobulbaceae bacterium S3730MH12]
MKQQFDPLVGRVFSVFSYYAVPSVVGMVAVSSAFIVDGFFIGNYVGSRALAAVNLTLPVNSMLIGIALMLSIGGSVRCGKYLGQGNIRFASINFSYTLAAIVLFSLIITVLGTIFIKPLTMMLGADQSLAEPVNQYLSIILLFTLFQLGGLCLSFFLRVDGYPVLASIALIGGSILNIILDWFFVVQLTMGLQGAALATGISHTMGLFFVLFSFVLTKSRFRIVRDKCGWTEVIKNAANGFSEFANELSVGVVILLFNWVIMQKLGENGLAAFTIINYSIFFALMVCYAISESTQPIISKNYGALNGKRIYSFLKTASCTVIIIGISMSIIMFFFSEKLVETFLEKGDEKVADLAVMYARYVWPVFLFSGLNIVFSSYLTAMQKPIPSAVIALSRSLILPILLLLILPIFFGDIGIFMAIPLAEVVALAIAIFLVKRNSPNKLVSDG